MAIVTTRTRLCALSIKQRAPPASSSSFLSFLGARYSTGFSRLLLLFLFLLLFLTLLCIRLCTALFAASSPLSHSSRPTPTFDAVYRIRLAKAVNKIWTWGSSLNVWSMTYGLPSACGRALDTTRTFGSAFSCGRGTRCIDPGPTIPTVVPSINVQSRTYGSAISCGRGTLVKGPWANNSIFVGLEFAEPGRV